MRFFCQTCPYVHKLLETVTKTVPTGKKKEEDEVLGTEAMFANAAKTSGEARTQPLRARATPHCGIRPRHRRGLTPLFPFRSGVRQVRARQGVLH